MQKFYIVLLVLLAAVLVSGVASAGGPYPSGVQVFDVKDHTCVLSTSGDLECFCPCAAGCGTTVAETPTTPDVTKTVITTTPADPTDTPTPRPTETPKPKCNRGIGNDSEGCDPGNSSGQGKGAGRDAGEDRNEHKK